MYRRIIILSLLVLSLVACGADKQTYTTVSAGTIKAGDAIPAPAGPVILTLSGNIGAKNAGAQLDFDMETLEKLGLVSFKVQDPFLRKEVTYEGVLLQQLLAVIQAPESATVLATTAINDYKSEVPVAMIKKWPVVLATKRDGQRMPTSDKGPLEIVFPYGTYDIDPPTHDQYWVWQLRSIEVR